MSDWLIYGANGYTGTLIAKEAVSRGLRPLLPGRSQAVAEMATRLGLPNALLCSALALLAGLVTIRKHRLSARHLAMAPSVVRD